MIETYYRILRHDPDGRLVHDTGLLPSHSYVIQFMELMQGLLAAGDITATDVDGAESVMVDESDAINTKGKLTPPGDDTQGIVVGTNAGTTAEANDNHALDTKILHSAVGAANKLNYQGMVIPVPVVDGANVDFDLSRSFLNETGGNITVKEIGIIIKNSTDTKYHLILRDVVADEVVPTANTLTVVYTLRTTV